MVPAILYGTAWKDDDTRRCVEQALAAGFRGFDTANQRKHYHEEAVGDALGAALAAGRVRRDELFVQTKFTALDGQDARLPYERDAPVAVQVRQSFASSLEHLRTDFLDSLVLHGPSSHVGVTAEDWQAWRAMEELHREGRARSLGVSNVTARQLELLLANARVQPRWVQNRCYARFGWDLEVRALCRARAIVYQGFSLLTANREVLRRQDVAELARTRGCTIAQVVFAFARAVGMVPLTGTADPAHMREDLAAMSIALTPAEVGLVEGTTSR